MGALKKRTCYLIVLKEHLVLKYSSEKLKNGKENHVHAVFVKPRFDK